jgi:hypothetical protein
VSKDRSKRALLESLADEGFIPPDNWSADGIVRVEINRLRRAAYIGAVAAEVPRRLGEGAESIDLAGDRFLSKRIANAYWTLWRRMTTAKHAPLPVEELGENEQDLYPPDTWRLLHARAASDIEARRMGRTVLWDRWWEESKPRLLARRRAIATFAVRDDRLSWGYRVVTSINNEIEWVDDRFDTFYDRYIHDSDIAI